MKSELRTTIAIVGIALLVSGCVPSDRDGNKPEQIVSEFIGAVQAGDLNKAASFWDARSIQNVQTNRHVTFEEFCRQHFAFERFETGDTFRGKSGYYAVEVTGMIRGESVGTRVYCRIMNGKWRMGEDLWLSPASRDGAGRRGVVETGATNKH